MWPDNVTKKDLKIDYFSGTGAGGQHRNKHKNCVRMVHMPTGKKSQCQDHKSKQQNLQTAFKRLAKQLVPIMQQEELRERFAAGKETVRSYVAYRGVVKDHRIPDMTFNYKDVLDGEGLGKLIEELAIPQVQLEVDESG